MARKIVIPGGSGAVGQLLACHFHRLGDRVTVLSRRPQATAWRTLPWDGISQGAWTREVDGSDIVINLAGRSVDCRYHAGNRREIINSQRFDARSGEGDCRLPAPPKLWLNASTATIRSRCCASAPR
jgi:NAD dependent epimerase/dehydratase family enzyme